MLYCFDVDGTLIVSFFRKGVQKTLENYGRVELLPGRRERVARLAAEPDSRFALVTNQAGVALGYQRPGDVWRKMAAVVGELDCFGGRPVSVHACLHHRRASLPEWQMDPCPRRKPAPGMLFEAMYAHGVEHLGYDRGPGARECRPDGTVLFVGDMDTDVQAARRAGVGYLDAARFFA